MQIIFVHWKRQLLMVMILLPMCVSHSVVLDSSQPRGLQSTRLLCPWNSSGKNTGVGCHFLLQGIFPIQESNPGLLHCRQTFLPSELPGKPTLVPHKVTVARLCWTLCDPIDYTVHGFLQARILEWVAFLFLLQEIFPTQGSNPSLLHCRQVLYQLSHKGSPRILKWVSYPFSKGTFQPRNQTRVSSIAGRFFTNEAIREAHPVG